MILNKQNFIYLILIIFSIYCTGVAATDCDVYKGIVGNYQLYKEDLEGVNGQCCRLDHRMKCDAQNNIISVDFYIMPCSIKSLFEQLSNLPKLEEIDIDMDDEPIPSTLQKLTQLKRLKIRYPSYYNNRYNIPNEIGSLVNLEEIDLSGSNLSGKIPNSIGNLVKLRHLDLHENHLEGYIPYEFKNLKNLEYLNLSGNILKGFVPPIQSLSNCNVEFNDEMCYLKSSRCRSNLKECTLDQIKTTNNNNNNPKPESGEFENEKDITQTSNNNDIDNNDVDNNDSNDSYYSDDYIYGDKNEPSDSKDSKIRFLLTFLVVISVGIIIVAAIFIIIYKMGNKKPKFTKFDDGNDNPIISGDPADDHEINNINNNNAARSTTPQPTTYSYNYGPDHIPIPTPVAPTTPVYYPVPSPVPAAAQPSTYIPPSPATPYAIPISQPGMTYANPIHPPPQTSTYAPPPQTSTYAPPPQPEVNNPPASTQPELDYPLPFPEQQRSPDDVLPPYESLSRSLGRPQ